jgi:hypothetical protein
MSCCNYHACQTPFSTRFLWMRRRRKGDETGGELIPNPLLQRVPSVQTMRTTCKEAWFTISICNGAYIAVKSLKTSFYMFNFVTYEVNRSGQNGLSLMCWLMLVDSCQISLDKQSYAKPELEAYIVVETCFYVFNLYFEADATSMSHILFDFNDGDRTFPHDISLHNIGYLHKYILIWRYKKRSIWVRVGRKRLIILA